MLLFMQKVSPKAGVIMQQPLLEEVIMVVEVLIILVEVVVPLI